MSKNIATITVAVFFIGFFLFTPFRTDSQVTAQDPVPGTSVFLPILFNNYDPSWQWRDKIEVSLNPYPAKSPLMVIDNSSRIHLFWDTNYNPQFIYHSYLTENGWTQPTPIANTLGTSSALGNPIVTPDGVIHILWANQLTPLGTDRLMYANFDGTKWSQEEVVADGQTYSISGSLSYDENGNVHVLYNGLNHRVRSTSGWSPVETITPPSVARYYYIGWTGIMDHFGGIQFLGKPIFYDNVFYSYWKSGKFQTSPKELPGVKNSSSIFSAASGEIHFYYSNTVPVPGGNVTGVYHRCLNTNSTLSPEQVLSGQEDTTYTILPVGDDSNRVVMIWEPSPQSVIRLGIFDGCVQTATKTANVFAPNESFIYNGIANAAMKADSKKLCVLLHVSYLSSDYKILCADIYH